MEEPAKEINEEIPFHAFDRPKPPPQDDIISFVCVEECKLKLNFGVELPMVQVCKLGGRLA